MTFWERIEYMGMKRAARSMHCQGYPELARKMEVQAEQLKK